MIDDFITIKPCQGDLPAQDENWVKQSYEQREEELVIHIVQATGYAPSQKMIATRAVSFRIKPNTTISEIARLLPEIKERLIIDGFQISIDRKKQRATILFEWYDRNKNTVVQFYDWRQIRLSVILLLRLDLPFSEYPSVFHKHFVEEIYHLDNRSFERAYQWLSQAKPGKGNFNILYHALKAAENACINNGKY